MTIAILSDIHGNLEAFVQVMEDLRTRPIDAIISLGDNIGYGPDSEAVMELVRKSGIESVLGNHEMVVKNQRYLKWFNPAARKAVRICLEQLSNHSREIISGFPMAIDRGDLYFVHGTPPCSPFLYLFQLPDSTIMKKLDAMDQRLIFIGHTHDLGLVEYNGNDLASLELGRGSHTLKRDRQYIISSGSVGQPRDGDPRAKYLTYDPATDTLDVHFISYDAALTAQKIVKAGIPVQYAEKLTKRF